MRTIWVRGVLVVCVVAMGSAAARAQQVLAELRLPGEFGSIGNVVGRLGDITGDGESELLVGGPVGTFVKSSAGGGTLTFASNHLETPIAVDGVGDLDGDGAPDFVSVTNVTIRACSSADGSVLWTAPAGTGSNFKGAVDDLQDVDGDGIPDVAVSESQVPSTPQIRVFSGADGAEVYAESGTGFSMDSVEWDGTPGLELVVGEPTYSAHGIGTGRVRVIEPTDGETLAVFVPGEAGGIGRAVANLGDVNGDGMPDIIGSPTFVQGVTTVWSGEDGSVLYPLPSTFFFDVERVGDVNGDGRPDFVGGGPGGGVGGFGSAQLRDGATGAVIQTMSISELTAFINFTGVGDVTGDGLPDLLVGSNGSPFNSALASARVLSLPSGAQIAQITNSAGGSALGHSLDHAGDFDGDGQGDFVLASSVGLNVFSADGELLRTIPSTSASAFGAAAFSVACPGDVNADGVPDFALGQGLDGILNFSGKLSLFSGADGSLIASIAGAAGVQLGTAVVDVPDRNGDGIRDLYVSAPATVISSLANVGEVRLVSGSNLSLITSFHGDVQASELFGWTLDTDGDLDHDGVMDLAVGGRGSTMYVMSGATGLELTRKTTEAAPPDVYASLVGDANGDGVEDYLAREPFYNNPAAVPPILSPGRVRLFSGSNGALLWEQIGTVPNGALGLYADGAGDVDGDGYADVAFTGKSANVLLSSGSVWVRSGRTGAVIDTVALPPSAAGGNDAGAVMSAGYVNAGGCHELIAGVPTLGSNGGAHILASSGGGVHGFIDLGFSKPGQGGIAPELRGYGDLGPGGQVSIKVRHAKASTNGAWFIGLSAGNLPFKQGVLVPSPAGFFVTVPLGTNGAGQVTINANNGPSILTGLSLYHQFWFADPGGTAGVSATNGMREIFK